MKRAHDILQLLVPWARGEDPDSRASGPGALMASTIHFEIVSFESGVKALS